MSAAPAVSVVVLCSQSPDPHLPATLASIREQRWLEPQITVVDCSPVLDGGRGLAASMNEGVAAAKAGWLLFLRAGDRLIGDMVLSEALNWIRRTEAGVVAGETAFDDGRIVKLRSQVNPIAANFVPAGATFYRTSLFAENGPFDPSFPTQADYEFNLRLWKGHVRFKPIPLRIAASPVRRTRERRSWSWHGEEIRIRRRYFSRLRCLPWDLASVMRWGGGKIGQPFRRP